MYADLMAFPFPQDGLMNHFSGMKVHPCMNDFTRFHVTSVPPIVTHFKVVLREHRWFKEQIRLNGLHAKVVYGLQNPPSELNEKKVECLVLEGIRCMSLSYFEENEYGGGFYTPDTRLSPLGEKLIMWMIEHNMIIDLAHVGHTTARDILAILEKQNALGSVIISHAGCFAKYQHLRNFPDDILQSVAHLDGLIGIPTMTWLLHKNDNSLVPFLEHIEHLIAKVGADHVAIGSDGVYAPMTTEEDEKRFSFMQKNIDPTGQIFHARYPEESMIIHGPQRMPVIHINLMEQFGKTLAEKIVSTNVTGWLW
jgi:microsomal dipeptidase-like Zn-dependent dipeptidase